MAIPTLCDFGVGWMKRYTEVLCRFYAEKLKNGMATVVVRPSNIYGPYDDLDFATSHVMSATNIQPRTGTTPSRYGAPGKTSETSSISMTLLTP